MAAETFISTRWEIGKRLVGLGWLCLERAGNPVRLRRSPQLLGVSSLLLQPVRETTVIGCGPSFIRR